MILLLLLKGVAAAPGEQSKPFNAVLAIAKNKEPKCSIVYVKGRRVKGPTSKQKGKPLLILLV